MKDAPTNATLIPLQPWQIEEIKKALVEADRGDFASEDEVKAMFEKWTRPR
jgi:predicted transcriptional regulator